MLVSGCSKSDVTARPGGGGGEQTVEIVPAESSVNLDEFSGQIVSVEENAIYFQFSGTEEGTVSKAQTKVLLPALLVPGAIVYALTPSERFPHGYLGRVVEVIEEEEGGLVKALMERTTISESFDLFRVSGSFEMVAETDGGSSGFKIHGEDGYMYLTGHIDTKLGDAGKAEYSFAGEVSSGLRVHLDINQGLKVEDPHFKAEMYLKVETEFEFGCSVSGYHDFDIPMVTLSGRFIHPALAILEPFLKFQPVVTVEGEAGFTTGVNINRHILVTVENVNDTWLHDIRDVDGRLAPKTDFEGIDFNLSGNAYVGMMLGPGLRLCGLDSESITLRPSLGVEVSGEFNMDITGGNFYNTFKDTKVSLALQGRADVVVKAGGKTIKPLGVAKMNLWETEKYIFPEFESTQVEPTGDGVTAGYNATRDVLFPVSVATGVWTQDGSAKVSESEAEPYAFIEDTSFDFAGTHTGLEPGTYKVRPIVRIGTVDIPAEPQTEFEIESETKLVESVTWVDNETRSYTYDENGRMTRMDIIDLVDPEYSYYYDLRYPDDRTIVFYYDGNTSEPLYFRFDESGYLTKIEMSGNYYTDFRYGEDGTLESAHTYVADPKGIFNRHLSPTYENGDCSYMALHDTFQDTDGDEYDDSDVYDYAAKLTYTDIENRMNVDIFWDLWDFEEIGLFMKGISSRHLPDTQVGTYKYQYQIDSNGLVVAVTRTNIMEGNIDVFTISYIEN